MTPKPPKFKDCRPDCPEEEDRWFLPAGILNVLWGDVIPLLAAQCWQGTADPFGLSNAQLATLVRALPGWSRNGPWRDRVQGAVDYLGRPDAAPIRIVGEGAYDFLLSNQGVDVFLPERPDSARDMYRFYTFRRTGRDPIGIPGYLTRPVSARAANARTGPSQIWVDPDSIRDLAKLFPEGCEPGLEERVDKLVKGCRESRKARQERFKDPDKPAVPTDRLQVQLESVWNLVCMLEETRCWQVEGAVVAAIFTETPRVVASIWTDPGGSYEQRWPNGGDDGLREIFEERLETSLPGAHRMAFEEHPASAPSGPPWVADDIMLTSRGFFFPPRGERPDLSGMLDEIVHGRASNPVFTDTRSPPFP